MKSNAAATAATTTVSVVGMGADLVVGDVAVILETVTAPTAAVTATASVSEAVIVSKAVINAVD